MPYAELCLSDTSLPGDALVDVMMAYPILINRPLVVSPIGVKLCRPSEDGERVMDASGHRIA